MGVWLAGPGLVQLETNVIRWCCAMAGLPKDAGGVLTSGGSLANLTALTAARHARLPPRFQDGVLYVSDQVHHSVVKAARVVGILPDHVREIPTDAAFKMRVEKAPATPLPRTAGQGACRFAWWATGAPPTPVQWMNFQRLVRCVLGRNSGSTWTPRTVVFLRSPNAERPRCPAWNTRTASRGPAQGAVSSLRHRVPVGA